MNRRTVLWQLLGSTLTGSGLRLLPGRAVSGVSEAARDRILIDVDRTLNARAVLGVEDFRRAVEMLRSQLPMEVELRIVLHPDEADRLRPQLSESELFRNALIYERINHGR